MGLEYLPSFTINYKPNVGKIYVNMAYLEHLGSSSFLSSTVGLVFFLKTHWKDSYHNEPCEQLLSYSPSLQRQNNDRNNFTWLNSTGNFQKVLDTCCIDENSLAYQSRIASYTRDVSGQVKSKV